LAANTLHSDDLDYVNSRLGLLYFCLGLFEILTGVLFGYLYDNVGKRTTLMVLLTSMLLGGFFTYLGYLLDLFYIYFPAVAFFGIGDCGSHTLVGALLSEKYGEKYEPHAAYRFVFGNSMGITVLIGALLKD